MGTGTVEVPAIVGSSVSPVPLEQDIAATDNNPMSNKDVELETTFNLTQPKRVVPVELTELVQRSAFVP